MRKIILAVIVLVVLGSATAFLVYRYKNKPVPTLLGWKANVTTIAGDGSPFVLSDPLKRIPTLRLMISSL